MQIYIDGKYYSPTDAKISVFDHGFLYGDGVFEGIRVYKNNLFALKEHIDRLYEGAKQIYLTIPLSKQELEQAIIDTLKQSDFEKNNIQYIRLVISRGMGDLGIGIKSCKKASVIIIPSQITVYPKEIYEKGLKLMTSSQQTKSFLNLPPRIKSLNYLANVLAKEQAVQAGFDNAILLNAMGFISEATVENVFVKKGSDVFTPFLNDGALGGITRELLIQKILPEIGYSVIERNLTVFDLKSADEVFLCGTAVEIMRVDSLDGISIGNQESSKAFFTIKVRECFQNYTQYYGVKIFLILCLFDIDGTLLKSPRGLGSLSFYEALCESSNINDLSLEEFRKNSSFAHGGTDFLIWKQWRNQFKYPSTEENFLLFKQLFKKKIQQHLNNEYTIEVFSGVSKILKLCQKHVGIERMKIFTGNIFEGAQAKLQAGKLETYFDVKNSYYTYYGIQSKLELIPKENINKVIFGDTPQDIEAGKKMNAFTVGIALGQYSKQDLLNNRAHLVYDNWLSINFDLLIHKIYTFFDLRKRF